MLKEDSAKTKASDPVIGGLEKLLMRHHSERVVVVGTTCTGKSTMLAHIPQARDQDEEVFPTLSKTEADYVCQEPWTEEIGNAMTRFVRERVKSEQGRPVFGTVVIEADFIVLLKISDELLALRARKRKVDFQSAKDMQCRIERDVKASGIPYAEYAVG